MRTLAALFKALSDETRLSMLGLLLREGELCVCDFVEVLAVTQSKASRHLRYLVNTGLLQDRREGLWVHYRITENPGLTQATVLSSLRGVLRNQVPKEMLKALKAWQRSKVRGKFACRPSAARGRARGRQR